jgi:hypothetical protein
MAEYCGLPSKSKRIGWAAAPGTLAAGQLAVRWTGLEGPAGGESATLSLHFSDLVAVNASSTAENSDQVSGGGAPPSRIAASLLMARQVATVRTHESARYRSELGDAAYADLLGPPPLSSGPPPHAGGRLVLVPNTTRAIWLAIELPPSTLPGNYTGTLELRLASGAAGDGSVAGTPAAIITSVPISISLLVWPIDPECIARETASFGKAWGFDRGVTEDLYPPNATAAATASFEEALCKAHAPPEALATARAAERPLDEIRALLATPCAQRVFNAAFLGGFTSEPPPSNFTPAFIDSVLARIAPRMAQLESAGLLERAYVYGFDESGEAYRGAVKALFGAVKARWPSVRTLAVLNWPVQAELEVDIWVTQYEKLELPEFREAKEAMQLAGREVWGYHCVSPTPAGYLNTFVDVLLVKARLIPWLAAAHGLDGWLYWYTNWGARHAPSARDPGTGKVRPLGPIAADGSVGYDPAVAANAAALADGHFTNEDGNLIYAGPAGALSSLRLEALRMGFEDRALLQLLNATAGSQLAQAIVAGAANYTIDPESIEAARRHAASLIGTRTCRRR